MLNRMVYISNKNKSTSLVGSNKSLRGADVFGEEITDPTVTVRAFVSPSALSLFGDDDEVLFYIGDRSRSISLTPSNKWEDTQTLEGTIGTSYSVTAAVPDRCCYRVIYNGEENGVYDLSIIVFCKYNDIEITGDILFFGVNGIYANSGSVYDFDWEYNTVNDRISNFTQKIETKTMPIIIKGYSEKNAFQKKDEIQRIFDYDRINATPGRLYVCGSYLSCYITGIKYKNSWMTTEGYFIECDLTILTDDSVWRKERMFVWDPDNPPSGTDAKISTDYECEYILATVVTDSSGFVADNYVSIGGQKIGSRSFDSTTQIGYGHMGIYTNARGKNLAYKINNAGTTKTNFFPYRYIANNNMFKRIKPGTYTITQSAERGGSSQYGYTEYLHFLKLEELRSEPEWEGR